MSCTKLQVHNLSQCCQGRLSNGHRQHAQKFDEVRTRGFRVMRADKQTDFTIFCTHPGGEVMVSIQY